MMEESRQEKSIDRSAIPTSNANADALWYIVLGVFALVFLISAFAVLVGFFTTGWTETERAPVVSSDVVYAIFTLVAGGLAGLVAPGPPKKRVAKNRRAQDERDTAPKVAWLVIAGALAAVLLGVTVVLVIGFFIGGEEDPFSVGIDKMMALATAVFGYMVGFVSPSPVAGR